MAHIQGSYELPCQIRRLNKKAGENSPAFFEGRLKGFEPSTFGTTIRRSNLLSYNLHLLQAGAKILLAGLIRQKNVYEN